MSLLLKHPTMKNASKNARKIKPILLIRSFHPTPPLSTSPWEIEKLSGKESTKLLMILSWLKELSNPQTYNKAMLVIAISLLPSPPSPKDPKESNQSLIIK